MKSMSTSMQNAFLNTVDCFHPISSLSVNILYANGTCSWLHAGRRPTYWCIRPSENRLTYSRPYLVHHPSKSTGGICTPRKAEETDLVPGLVYMVC